MFGWLTQFVPTINKVKMHEIPTYSKEEINANSYGNKSNEMELCITY